MFRCVGNPRGSMRSPWRLLYASCEGRSSPLLYPPIHADEDGLEFSFKNPRNICVRPRKSAEKEVVYWPVPVSFITAGLNGALLLTVTAPLIDPFTFGVNVTLNVQVAPEATVVPQGVPPEGVAE